MDCARIAQKLREQMVRFSGELSSGFPKVVGRFIAEMVYGVQARQSVRLTEVSRALDEAIPIKKTVERLSRQLGNPKLGAGLTSRLLRLAADRIRETTLLILDIADVHWVLRYVRLQNMMAMLMAVVYFTAVYLGIKLKLRVLARHIVRAARRVFGIPFRVPQVAAHRT